MGSNKSVVMISSTQQLMQKTEQHQYTVTQCHSRQKWIDIEIH